jgi:ElaB/YqjD/DUF883 family membrane-anchored ribosome-binding protein
MDHLDPTRHPQPPRFNAHANTQANLPLDAQQSQPDAPPQPVQPRLIGDLQQVIDNAEDLLNCTDSARDGAYRAAREKLAQALAIANDELQRIEDAQLERMIAATHEASMRHNDRTGEARLLRAFH